MAPVTMPPVEEARSIFQRLGYSVSGHGTEMRAERKWRTVHVTAVASEDEVESRRVVADGGREGGHDLRCFVTWKEYTGALANRLRTAETPFEWAIIGVEDGGGYEVVGAS